MMIATRALKLTRPEDAIDIPVRIFAPEQDGDGWICRYEIDWPEGRQKMAVGGLDSVQALVLALQMIGSDLYTSSYHKAGALSFSPSGGYGFPIAQNLRDLLTGDDASYL